MVCTDRALTFTFVIGESTPGGRDSGRYVAALTLTLGVTRSAFDHTGLPEAYSSASDSALLFTGMAGAATLSSLEPQSIASRGD
ncbi:unnamed protein product, partial [Iphiclides podalirius]